MNVNRVKPKPYWLKIREKERYKLELLVREKGDPSGRRLPIRMGGPSVQYSLLFDSAADGVSLSLSLSSAGFGKCAFGTGRKGISWSRWECVFCIG